MIAPIPYGSDPFSSPFYQWLEEVRNEINAGSGALVYLSSQTAASSATLDFTSGIDSTYDEYVFSLAQLTPATDGAALWSRISQDSGSTWKAGVTDYEYIGNGRDTGAAVTFQSAGAAQMIFADNVGNAATESVSGYIHLFGPSGTAKYKQFRGATIYQTSAGGATLTEADVGGFYNTDASAINGVRFLMSSGNIASGSIHLYGVRKS